MARVNGSDLAVANERHSHISEKHCQKCQCDTGRGWQKRCVLHRKGGGVDLPRLRSSRAAEYSFGSLRSTARLKYGKDAVAGVEEEAGHLKCKICIKKKCNCKNYAKKPAYKATSKDLHSEQNYAGDL